MDIKDYLDQKKIALGKRVLSKHRVYLDTRFWVSLRDTELGRSREADQKKLLQLCRHLASRGTVIFPLSYSIFGELHLQSDEQTLLHTAKLIDELSHGVCIQPPEIQFQQELACFIRSNLEDPNTLFTPEQLIWTRSSFVVGELNGFSELSGEKNFELKKQFFDEMWNLGLFEQTQILLSKGPLDREDTRSSLAATLNSGKAEHATDFSNFKQLFLIELAGGMDGFRDYIKNVMLGTLDPFAHFSTTPERDIEQEVQLFMNMIYNCFDLRYEMICQSLPQMTIHAAMHAMARYDKKRKYRKTDFQDFYHASAALPYCDAFFTEGHLATILKQRHLKFDELFKTVVTNDYDEAIAHLESQLK